MHQIINKYLFSCIFRSEGSRIFKTRHFLKIAYWERQAFDTAFAEVSSEMMKPLGFSAPKQPALTIIVCQRNANYRLISSGGSGFMSSSPPEENCPPGTVLDTTVGKTGVGIHLLSLSSKYRLIRINKLNFF